MHAVHIKCLNYVDFYIFFLATATKYHAIYINFSASARFSTHTGCLAIARRGRSSVLLGTGNITGVIPVGVAL